jgi:hypothetical protein
VNLLDENIVANQRERLKGWHIPIRHVGYDIKQQGLQDEAIIPFLLELRYPTFFTRDSDFYDRNLRHARYGLVCLVIGQYEVATFARRLLHHPEFDTTAKRMGRVIRVTRADISVWELHAEREIHFDWNRS